MYWSMLDFSILIRGLDGSPETKKFLVGRVNFKYQIRKNGQYSITSNSSIRLITKKPSILCIHVNSQRINYFCDDLGG